MRKILSLALCLLMIVSCFAFASCGSETIVVQTNAFFAPFEYYDGTEIVGVDVEIMNMVGENLGKNVEFENVEFAAIIDNVKDATITIKKNGTSTSLDECSVEANEVVEINSVTVTQNVVE